MIESFKGFYSLLHDQLHISPSPQDLYNAFQRPNYLLIDYQAVTVAVYAQYFLGKDFMRRYVLIDSYIYGKGDVHTFVDLFCSEWSSMPDNTRLQLLIRTTPVAAEKSDHFYHHWILLDIKKMSANKLSIFYIDSLANQSEDERCISPHGKKISNIFASKMGRLVVMIEEVYSEYMTQAKYFYCAIFTLVAAFNLAEKVPRLHEDKEAYTQIRENIRVINYERENNMDPVSAVLLLYTQNLNTIISFIAPNKTLPKDHPFRELQILFRRAINLENTITTKAEEIKQQCLCFLTYLMKNPKDYEKILKARITGERGLACSLFIKSTQSTQMYSKAMIEKLYYIFIRAVALSFRQLANAPEGCALMYNLRTYIEVVIPKITDNNLSISDFCFRILKTRINGSKNLHELLRELPLDSRPNDFLKVIEAKENNNHPKNKPPTYLPGSIKTLWHNLPSESVY
jgi:hypothetical protein